jgi:hypothetical protein
MSISQQDLKREMYLLGRVGASTVASGRRQRGGGIIQAGGGGMEVAPSGRRRWGGGSIGPGGSGVEVALSGRTRVPPSTSPSGADLAGPEEDRGGVGLTGGWVGGGGPAFGHRRAGDRVSGTYGGAKAIVDLSERAALRVSERVGAGPEAATQG